MNSCQEVQNMNRLFRRKTRSARVEKVDGRVRHFTSENVKIVHGQEIQLEVTHSRSSAPVQGNKEHFLSLIRKYLGKTKKPTITAIDTLSFIKPCCLKTLLGVRVQIAATAVLSKMKFTGVFFTPFELGALERVVKYKDGCFCVNTKEFKNCDFGTAIQLLPQCANVSLTSRYLVPKEYLYYMLSQTNRNDKEHLLPYQLVMLQKLVGKYSRSEDIYKIFEHYSNDTIGAPHRPRPCIFICAGFDGSVKLFR